LGLILKKMTTTTTTPLDDENDCHSPDCRQFNQTFAAFDTVHAAAATPTVTPSSHFTNPQIYAIGGSAAAAIVLAGLVAGLLISRNHRRKATLQNQVDSTSRPKRNASVPAVSMANAPMKPGHGRRNQSTPNVSLRLQESDVVRRQSMTFSKLTHPRALAPAVNVPVPELPELPVFPALPMVMAIPDVDIDDGNKAVQHKHKHKHHQNDKGGDALKIPREGGRTRTLSSVHRDGSLQAGHELYGFI